MWAYPVGYSGCFLLTDFIVQDTVLCGNGDPKQSVSSTGSIAGYNIKAAIFMGDPRYETGAPYNVGTCKAGGVSWNCSGTLVEPLLT